jgi:hypothetical protein
VVLGDDLATEATGKKSFASAGNRTPGVQSAVRGNKTINIQKVKELVMDGRIILN